MATYGFSAGDSIKRTHIITARTLIKVKRGQFLYFSNTTVSAQFSEPYTDPTMRVMVEAR